MKYDSTQREELRKLAEEANGGPPNGIAVSEWWQDVGLRFSNAASPKVVLALLDALDAAEGEVERLKGALESAAVSLDEAADDIADWGAYADTYFQDKHDLSGAVQAPRTACRIARSALAGEPG